ncbi:transmembrane protein 45B [Boleophthalmus pectinirostris]|uniref:transmembrane protein 45B n=1 Tax=Boleophthalmus pectinirostris TaxID=150288 RepID=UPI000A1C760B|nr:transmembrane protein 45B [Boleophthalmus pectinirostris]
MANFGGHAIPGSFFFLYGVWLTVKHILHHYWRMHQPKHRQGMAPFLKKMHYFEGGLQIFAASVGILVEQFVPDGPHAHLISGREWVKLMNWQHSTMYLFFGIAGVTLVASTASKLVPVGVDRLILSMALFVEGFLFYYHVSMRPHLDAHIHTLLLVAVFGGAASTMLEVFKRHNIILELLGAGFFILQGTWFYQIGFVLYPLSGPQWELEQHDNIMFVTMCFCWHLAVAVLLVTSTSFAVWFMLRRLSSNGRDIEIGMRNTSSASNSQKFLLEESEEE